MCGQVAGQKNESKSCISPPWQVALLMTKCNLALAPSFLDLPYFTLLGGCCWFAPACNWWLVFISSANHRRSRAQPEGDTSIPGVRSLLSIYRPVMLRCRVFMFQNSTATGAANAVAVMVSALVALLHSRGATGPCFSHGGNMPKFTCVGLT